MHKDTKMMIGDRVYRSKGAVMHVGVIVSENLVAHNSPDNNVEVVSIEQFAQGKELKYQRSTKVDPDALLSQLEKIKNENKRYCPFSFNCEHFANRLLGDNKGSGQLLAVVAIGALGLTSKNKWLGFLAAGSVGLVLCNSLRSYSTT
ncbi:hypothetical protein [Shewanella putrefaciens]|uniref:hypothetical protein n=1 Tax=Shewanella putrefaciens TaxID=24 RepID=UPI0018E7D674|nr:hypothetical protein [Shewanella putrefaciens]